MPFGYSEPPLPVAGPVEGPSLFAAPGPAWSYSGSGMAVGGPVFSVPPFFSNLNSAYPGATPSSPAIPPNELDALPQFAGPAGSPDVDISSAYDEPSASIIPTGGPADYPIPFNPGNLAPVGNTTPGPTARFLPPVLGIAGGLAGAALGGPVGALAGRVGGQLLGRFLANGGLGNLNLQPGGYNPNAPLSLTNVPPGNIGPSAVPLPNGMISYAGRSLASLNGMPWATNASRDPMRETQSAYRPFGPGSGRNQSSGYLGNGIAQGDAMQQALLARSAESGDRGPLNETLPTGFPLANLTGPAGAPMSAPVFGASDIPTLAQLLGLVPPLPGGPAAALPPSLSGDVISNALPPKP